MTYYDKSLEAQQQFNEPILLAKVGSQIHELLDEVDNENEQIEFLTINSMIGKKVYERSVVFLFLYAVDILYPNLKTEVLYHLKNGIYIECPELSNEKELQRITDVMMHAVLCDHKITKNTIQLSEAMKYFKEHNMTEKEKLFSYRRVSSITLYELDGFKNYFYGDLVYSTSVLSRFELHPYKNGLMLCLPDSTGEIKTPNEKDDEKLYNTLEQTNNWAKTLNVKTIGDLNNAIVNGNMDNIILLQEAAMERNIANIASDIIQKDKKIVLIAGPSSSAKTSLSKRLSVQLQTQGVNSHTIACDDYFRNRADIPFNEHGEQDLEAIEVVDLAKFDEDMTKLLNGETVEIPHFNFVSGEREYTGKNFITLKEHDIVIIEGIHCLNPRFLPSVNPYRIYISALTPLNIDTHNRISSSDLRMLRRMARDMRHRGTNPQATIKSWKTVRAGEEKNIFPYQENADVIFNSSLVYEVSMIKTLVEPMLFSIPKDSEEWVEAKRMLKFLDFFLAYPDDLVPNNSLIQEFLGGSCFDVG